MFYLFDNFSKSNNLHSVKIRREIVSRLIFPFLISEFGGGALYGYHGDKLTRWTEEFQENIYEANLRMFENVPFVCGLSPWILKDFRSPRRTLPRIQYFWNRKGLISDDGGRKKTFYRLQKYYENKNSQKK